jgi:hypothetical protein
LLSVVTNKDESISDVGTIKIHVLILICIPELKPCTVEKGVIFFTGFGCFCG